MIAQLSCAVHVIWRHYILAVMGACSDWSSGGGLGCDGVRPKGSSRVQLELISGLNRSGKS